jgi:hypothetical protein
MRNVGLAILALGHAAGEAFHILLNIRAPTILSLRSVVPAHRIPQNDLAGMIQSDPVDSGFSSCPS